MKITDLSNIMRLAWRFFKMTGVSFADCLKKAWANYNLVRAMKHGIVRFYFQKVDGSIREAWGTLQADVVPPIENDTRKKNDTVQVFFDTETQGWRCFKRFNLVF